MNSKSSKLIVYILQKKVSEMALLRPLTMRSLISTSFSAVHFDDKVNTIVFTFLPTSSSSASFAFSYERASDSELLLLAATEYAAICVACCILTSYMTCFSKTIVLATNFFTFSFPSLTACLTRKSSGTKMISIYSE